MKQLLIIIVLLYSSLQLFAQDKPVVDKTTPGNTVQEVKSKMVLRGTSRDQAYIIRDNQHRNLILQRKQGAIQRQQMMVRKRMHNVQRQRVVRQNIQKRRMRQQMNRSQQHHGGR